MSDQRNLVARATAFPSTASHAAAVVCEITAGLRVKAPTATHYHVLLDASGSMYRSALSAEQRAGHVSRALARGELERVVSDGDGLWTVTGETRSEMSLANATPMQSVVAGLLLALERLAPHADMGVTVFATDHAVAFESARQSSGVRESLELLTSRGWTPSIGDETYLGPALQTISRRIMEQTGPEAARHKVVLITDGLASDRAEALREFSRLMAAKAGVTILGVGDGPGQTVLMQAADAAGGQYHPLRQPVDIAYAIGVDSAADENLVTDELELLLRLRADLKLGGVLQLAPVTRELGPTVTPGAGILIPTGPLRAQESRLIVGTLSTRDRSVLDYTKALCSISLRFGDTPGMAEEQTMDVAMDSGDTPFSAAGRRAVMRAQAHMVRHAAEQARAAGDLARAERSYLQLARLLETLQHTDLAAEVLEQVRSISAARSAATTGGG